MKFVTFSVPGKPLQPGVLIEQQVVSLVPLGFHSLISVMEGGEAARSRIEDFVSSPPDEAVFELGTVDLKAPIPRPPKIICVGLNYRDHAKESGMEIPSVPTIFSKFWNTIIGPGEPIVHPKNSTKVDYEAELAFVIGRRGRHIPKREWKRYVFGYMNFHDVSARDFQMATTQWLMGKTFDTFAPTGPYIVSADEIEDPHQLDIQCILNGEVMQHSNTRELIFQIPDLIEYLSSVMTLEPGDIVATGTPSGVGFARKPPRFLKPGDQVTIKIEGLGELTNPVVAEK